MKCLDLLDVSYVALCLKRIVLSKVAVKLKCFGKRLELFKLIGVPPTSVTSRAVLSVVYFFVSINCSNLF